MKWIKHKIAWWALSVVTPLPVLIPPRKLRDLSNEERKELREQTKVVKELAPVSYVVRLIKNRAKIKMFNKAETSEDILFSKTMLYTMDLFEKQLDLLEKLSDE